MAPQLSARRLQGLNEAVTLAAHQSPITQTLFRLLGRESLKAPLAGYEAPISLLHTLRLYRQPNSPISRTSLAQAVHWI